MFIVSSTSKTASDVIIINMTREQFTQLISVVAVARSSVDAFGTSYFEADSIAKVVNFYNIFKNIKAVQGP